MNEVLGRARSDALLLAEAGFDALMVENFGDAPFFAEDAPKVTIASLALAVSEVSATTLLPVGVNVLRNDGAGALAVAAAVDAAFVRVNVLTGMMYTDQGPIVGRAAEVARMRGEISPTTAIMADIFVKHATPPSGLTLIDATVDLVERGGADAVIVSGSGTGAPTSIEDVRTVVEHSHLPVFIGSGATAATLPDLLEVAYGAIVGSDTKIDGVATNPVDPRRAAAAVAAGRSHD